VQTSVCIPSLTPLFINSGKLTTPNQQITGGRTVNSYVQRVLDQLHENYPWQKEFLQAVTEVLESLSLLMDREPRYEYARILELLTEPERIIVFRVAWLDDNEEVHVNRGYRVQFNSALGPYRGGLRFHPSVNLSILKFLGFEQTLKNSLTGLPMGGAEGGSDFDPKGKSDYEVMKFCQSFMRELYRHIGPDIDVPAGDIGVSGREIGYLYGQYKKILSANKSVLTGKQVNWGNNLIRPEAAGYGNAYFVAEMLKTRDESLEGKRVLISGSGNVAQFTAEKVLQLGGKVISLSDSNGTVIDEDGIDEEKLEYVRKLKNFRRGRIREYVGQYPTATYYEGKKPWGSVPAEVILPSATQNEIYGGDAQALIENGCICVSEGANMPSTPEAVEMFLTHKVLFGPGKAANSGGIAMSGLELTQNVLQLHWPREEVEQKLYTIMVNIHRAVAEAAEDYDMPGNYVVGANIAGFKKVADAMIDHGI
jgi:glutamate dehydrogenase (NADP+)